MNLVKEQLNVDGLIVYGDLDREICKVAVCGGSGAAFIYDAYLRGADLYITGDVKYHDSQQASELGLTIVDAGHYDTEKVILPAIKKYIEENTNGSLSVIIYDKISPLRVFY